MGRPKKYDKIRARCIYLTDNELKFCKQRSISFTKFFRQALKAFKDKKFEYEPFLADVDIFNPEDELNKQQPTAFDPNELTMDDIKHASEVVKNYEANLTLNANVAKITENIE